MHNKTIRRCAFVAAGLLLASTAHAFDMGNMMNPTKWMGGKDKGDRDSDYEDGPGYGNPGGYGGGPGYGYPGGYGGGPGYGGNSGYGYPGGYGSGYGGDPGYGYGAPGYGGMPGYGTTPGYGGMPGYGGAPAVGGMSGYTGAPPPSATSPDSGHADEIKQLKERIRKLEESSKPAGQPVWGQEGYGYR